MSDLERLDEAIAEAADDVRYQAEVLASEHPWPPILDAARAYRDLLANGEYKPVNAKGRRHHSDCLNDEPGVTLCTCNPLLVDPTTEEET